MQASPGFSFLQLQLSRLKDNFLKFEWVSKTAQEPSEFVDRKASLVPAEEIVLGQGRDRIEEETSFGQNGCFHPESTLLQEIHQFSPVPSIEGLHINGQGVEENCLAHSALVLHVEGQSHEEGCGVKLVVEGGCVQVQLLHFLFAHWHPGQFDYPLRVPFDELLEWRMQGFLEVWSLLESNNRVVIKRVKSILFFREGGRGVRTP